MLLILVVWVWFVVIIVVSVGVLFLINKYIVNILKVKMLKLGVLW